MVFGTVSIDGLYHDWLTGVEKITSIVSTLLQSWIFSNMFSLRQVISKAPRMEMKYRIFLNSTPAYTKTAKLRKLIRRSLQQSNGWFLYGQALLLTVTQIIILKLDGSHSNQKNFLSTVLTSRQLRPVLFHFQKTTECLFGIQYLRSQMFQCFNFTIT